ncbi:pre-RNA processing PIH1/Nop17-domain-containing protein [Phlebopus sp. FC_14]|nr:pre-RNA processing PIH1/Nop17-domain-containing protein [Phlebopus sp. FC_14]
MAATLNPVPGFCVKSKATNDAAVHRTASNLAQSPTHIPKGQKVFVNIAWDANIPPPPTANEQAIQRAINGLDIDESDPNAWFVPVVVSDARQDSDKAGQPAVVFDCVFNPSIKSRTLKDAEFKAFIIELAFQRIEAETSLVLSRQIGTPNIASKGKLPARQVRVPASLYPTEQDRRPTSTSTPATQPKLIQEIDNRVISTPNRNKPHPPSSSGRPQIPAWSWTEDESRICIVIQVPGMTHAVIPESTLDLERKRVILHIPSLYELDIDLEASDAELTSRFGSVDRVLELKRRRELDVDDARAEWRVADRAIVLVA